MLGEEPPEDSPVREEIDDAKMKSSPEVSEDLYAEILKSMESERNIYMCLIYHLLKAGHKFLNLGSH